MELSLQWRAVALAVLLAASAFAEKNAPVMAPVPSPAPAGGAELEDKAVRISREMDRMTSRERTASLYCTLVQMNCTLACAARGGNLQTQAQCVASCMSQCGACAQAEGVSATAACPSISPATRAPAMAR